jgi:hypothetical protein
VTENVFRQITVETFDSLGCEGWWMIGLWFTLAVLEAREGTFHGLTLDCCCLPEGRVRWRKS